MAVLHENFHMNQGPILASLIKVAPGAAFKLCGFELKLGGTPTTSENFVISKDDGNGSFYDTTIYSLDLSSGSITSLEHAFIGNKYTYKSTDVITFAWTNTQRLEWGLTVKYELE